MNVVCDYCGKPAVHVGGQIVYPHRPDLHHLKFWVCSPCDARVGCHVRDGLTPLGRLANADLRAAKQQAHAVFDPFWKTGERSRGDAYSLLAHRLGIRKVDCHIGLFDIHTCRKVIDICNQLRRENDKS